MRPVSHELFLAALCAASQIYSAPLASAQAAPHMQAVSRSFDPLTAPATHRLLPGKIVFSMLVTPDLPRAETFYSQLFGWGFRPVGNGKTQRVEIMLGSQPIGTVVAHRLDDPRHDVPFWTPFLSTSDTATVARVTRKQGGKVLFGPKQMEGLGEALIVADPQHGVYGALSAQAGDPVDPQSSEVAAIPALNNWAWATLLSPEPKAAAGFYQLLLNYKIVASPEEERTGHYMLMSQDRERASVNKLPDGIDQKDTARWIQFIQVQSSADTARKAETLGGKIIVPVHLDRDGAKIAILADPGGAVFGLIEPQKDDLSEGVAP